MSINKSKEGDPRRRKIWEQSGAIEGVEAAKLRQAASVIKKMEG